MTGIKKNSVYYLVAYSSVSEISVGCIKKLDEIFFKVRGIIQTSLSRVAGNSVYFFPIERVIGCGELPNSANQVVRSGPFVNSSRSRLHQQLLPWGKGKRFSLHRLIQSNSIPEGSDCHYGVKSSHIYYFNCTYIRVFQSHLHHIKNKNSNYRKS